MLVELCATGLVAIYESYNTIYGAKYAGKNFVTKHKGINILSMENTYLRTNGSQFIICTTKTKWLDRKHMVFGHNGQVVEGMNVPKDIKKVGSSSGKTSRLVANANWSTLFYLVLFLFPLSLLKMDKDHSVNQLYIFNKIKSKYPIYQWLGHGA
ncbi:hypothetical protein CR513_45475, partial [Mucuna pruriens]